MIKLQHQRKEIPLGIINWSQPFDFQSGFGGVYGKTEKP